MTARGIPFDSPLYTVDEHVDFTGCEAIRAVFSIAADVTPLLPDGLVPTNDPAIGGVNVIRYGFSQVGPYLEQFSFIQVQDPHGETGLYIPYIYVTTDVAMAAGRELLGAPKKLASITLGWENDLIQGVLERPTGKRLLTLTIKPEARIDAEMASGLVPPRSNVYSVRHLPPIGGKGGVTQLVKWYSEITVERDARGGEMLFAGPTSITYDSPSVIDPVHRLAVGQVVMGGYSRFDLRLGTTQILSEM